MHILEIDIQADDPAYIPKYATDGSAGLDLRAAISVIILPKTKLLVSCGFRLALPAGYAALVTPRSGLAQRGLTIPNSPGLIDSDYRGYVSVILRNDSTETFVITNGDRIAQMVILPVPTIIFREVSKLDETARGSGGFGSTGSW